jgi:ribosomal protein S18 acetylase RimI-like enzyme
MRVSKFMRPSTYRIRELARQDWAAYRALRLCALADSPDAFGTLLEDEAVRPLEYWQQRVAQGESATELPLIAEMDGSAVGLAWGRVDPATPSRVEINQVWVAADARGCGIGRALMSRVVAWARARGARCVALEVTIGDTPAMHLYESLGFRRSGAPQPVRPGSLLQEQPMELQLVGPA